MAMDLPNNTTTTGVVTIGGGPVKGLTDGAGDSDWYAVTLIAGVSYQFSAFAYDVDPVLTLRDATGAPLFRSNPFVFTAEQSGIYYLDVSRGFRTVTGDYFVSADIYVPQLGASDVAGSAATTANLTVGGPAVVGVAEDLGDSDWYSVQLEAGHTYEFTVGQNAFGSVLPYDTYLVLRDAAGNAVTHSIATPVSIDTLASITFTATETGNYFLDLRTLVLETSGQLEYWVTANEFVPSDDPVNAITTTAVISADGVPVEGLFETSNEHDWYGVTLNVGVTYAFTFNTRIGGGATLVLRDQSGAVLNFSSTDFGTTPTFTFTPSATGQYFLDATTRTSQGGAYEITVGPAIPDPTDVPGNQTTPVDLSLDGVPLAGIFEQNGGDRDWYRVTLTAGVTYQFDLNDIRFLNEPVLGLLDADGQELQFSALNSSREMASIVFTAEQSGIYYLDARCNDDGEYKISGREFVPIPGDTVGANPDMAGVLLIDGAPLSAAIDDFGDKDWYAVTLEAGHTYSFTANGEEFSYPQLALLTSSGLRLSGDDAGNNPLEAGFTFTAKVSGTYYLDITGAPGVFEIAAIDLAAADVPGDVTTSETLTFDVPVSVSLGSLGDSDWYAIQLAAGQSYSFRLLSRFVGVSCDLYDAAGLLLESGESNNNSNSFFPLTSEFIHFTAASDGTYYVAATLGNSGQIDNYTLDVVPDDYGDNASWTGLIGPGDTAAQFENYYDVDFMRLDVESGKIYTLSWSGTSIRATLTIDDARYQSNTSFTFKATDSMPVFNAAYFGFNPTAEYAISLNERTDIVDSHGDTLADATEVQLGAVTGGAIEAVRDRDVMKVTLEAGKIYSFDVTKAGMQPLQSFQYDIKDADGNVVASSNSSPLRPFHFAPTESGTYYLDISNSEFFFDGTIIPDDSVGTYEVKISEDTPDRTPVRAVDGGGSLLSNIIKVYFAEAGYAYPRSVIRRGDGVAGDWSAAQKAAVQGVFDRYENAINLQFIEVNSAADANFVFVNDSDANGTFFGAPGTANAGLGVFGTTFYHGLAEGGAEVERIAQAIGRGLGLKSPQDAGPDGIASEMFNVRRGGSDYASGLFDLNQSVYTVMSTIHGWSAPSPFDFWPLDRSKISLFGHQIGPAALDIAALQAKYGANTTFANGNTVYTLVGTNGQGTSWQTIWDTGGADEIRYDGFRDTLINLNDATGIYAEGGGGFVSNVGGVHGGLTIARGVAIENARGGSGDDVLIGNEAANVLRGNGGDDLIEGGAGNDRIDGGTGTDTASYASAAAGVRIDLSQRGEQNTGGAGRDTVLKIENLLGSKFDDRLAGDHKANQLSGGQGNDRADGGAGNDTFLATANDSNDRYDGGAGRDLLDFSGITAAVTVNLVTGFAASASTGSDRFWGIEDFTGGSGGDVITASGAINHFLGGAGGDRFMFRSAEAAGLLGSRDQIGDFADGDRLDVSGIDANQSARGNQAFAFAGLIPSVSHGLGSLARGQIGYRYFTNASGVEHTLIEGNIRASSAADLQIDLVGHHVLTAGDFLL
jgi:hypothetical protein